MNYKYLILGAFLSVNFSSSIIFAMENKHQKDYSVCNFIKQINPNASPSDYLSLAAKIHEAKLDTCQCIKYLMKQKKQKAWNKEKLKKYGVSEEQFNEIQEEIKVEKAKFRKKQNKGLIVECNPDVPKEICGMITDAFRKNGAQGNLFVKYLTSEECLAGIQTRRKSFLKSFKFDDQFLKCNQQQKNALIHHEQVHFVKEHGLKREVLIRNLIEALRKYGLNYGIVNGVLGISRVQEAEADRLPAACFDCSAAEDMEILFKKFKQDHDQMIENLVLNPLNDKKLKEFREKIVSDPHPIPQKRLDWAKRIKNLRNAHEGIKKIEKENFLKMKNNLNTLLAYNPF